jgi:hypothetical protein
MLHQEILSKSEENLPKIPRRFGLTVLDLKKKKKK